MKPSHSLTRSLPKFPLFLPKPPTSLTIPLFPLKFPQTSPKFCLSHHPLSLSKTLTSIIEVEGYREWKFISFSSLLLQASKGTDLFQIATMGKKKVREGSKAPSMPKKAPRAPSSFSTRSIAKGNKDAYPLILPASTRGLYFVSDGQRAHYENLTNRKTSEQKFLHVDPLTT